VRRGFPPLTSWNAGASPAKAGRALTGDILSYLEKIPKERVKKNKGYLRFLYIVVVSFTALTSSNPALISFPSSSIEWHTL